MLASLKAWLVGLSTAGKVGVATALVATSAIAIPVTTACREAPVTASITVSETIQPTTTYVKDGTLKEGELKVKTEGEPGSKDVTYDVTTKCGKEQGRSFVSEKETKTPKVTVSSKGTKHTISENVSIPFEVRTEYDSSLASGTTKIRSQGVNGTKKVTYEVSQNEGEEEIKKVVDETITAEPVTQVNVIGTYVPPPPPPPTNNGATAKCRDGTLSYSAHRQGTCSHHGGVAVWY